MNLAPLEQSILRTLAYFDLFSFPLSAEELYCFLWRPPALAKDDFLNQLNFLVEQKKIGNQDGFYFLLGTEANVAERIRREKISEKKMKKARRAARLLSLVPFLNAVFLCNSVAAGTANEKSDIDFLVITYPGRLWIVRSLSNFLLRITGMRTYGNSLANRVCLSFFVTEKKMDLANLRATEEDIHFAYWLHQTIPLFDPYYLWRDFIKANQWTARYLPYVKNYKKEVALVKLSKGANIWRRIWERFWQGWYGDLIEKQAEALGRQKMKLSVKEKAEKGDNSVVLNNGVIKLHEDDSRLRVKAEWEEKMKE